MASLKADPPRTIPVKDLDILFGKDPSIWTPPDEVAELIKGSLVVVSKKIDIKETGKYKVKFNLMVKAGVPDSFDLTLVVLPGGNIITKQKTLNPTGTSEYIESDAFSTTTKNTSVWIYLVSSNTTLKTGLVIGSVEINPQ